MSLEGQERQQVGLDLVAEGFIGPVGLTSPDDGSGRLFVVDLIGEIRIIDENGTLLEEPFLNIRDQLVELRLSFDERGLLGLAFHPDFAESGRFFIYYSAPLRKERRRDGIIPAGYQNSMSWQKMRIVQTPHPSG